MDTLLLSGLTRAVDWFDNSLQHVLESRGFKPVHRTQSLILIHISAGVDAPSDIAREMGITRQNVHQMARGLINEGIVEQFPDPRDPRRSRYRFAAPRSDIRAAALDALSKLERIMQQRTNLSDEEMATFRRVLAADWGPEVPSGDALDQLTEE